MENHNMCRCSRAYKFSIQAGVCVGLDSRLTAKDLASKSLDQLSGLTDFIANPEVLAYASPNTQAKLAWIQSDLVDTIKALWPIVTRGAH
ncbi:hypothetical protein ACFQUU_08850 [Herbaspirillum sp. GCM10030257]|uniref:hypothetical protein n=1 Tax=Herbaspirillum sp. GCM10030257 TaxID=3273393 RepID=UPI0036214214